MVRGVLAPVIRSASHARTKTPARGLPTLGPISVQRYAHCIDMFGRASQARSPALARSRLRGPSSVDAGQVSSRLRSLTTPPRGLPSRRTYS